MIIGASLSEPHTREKLKVIKEENELYIVPSSLPSDEDTQKKVPERTDKNARIVYYHLPDQFVPPMLFSQVVACCINRNEDKREDLIWYVCHRYHINCLLDYYKYLTYEYIVHDRLRKGKVKLMLGRGHSYCVSLCKKYCSIQVSFTLHGNNHSAKERIELLKFIQSKLELLMKDFMQASRKPIAYVPCYYQDCDELHVELQMLLDGEHQYCHTKDQDIPDHHYHDLFVDQGLLVLLRKLINLFYYFNSPH